jgi:hypothetical protein
MRIIQETLERDNERLHALFASTIEHLCDEMDMEPSEWVKADPSALSDGWERYVELGQNGGF